MMRVALLGALAGMSIGVPLTVQAQGNTPTRPQGGEAYLRGESLEDRSQYPEAATAYRQAVSQAPTSVAAVLGLERVYAQLGRLDSLLPVLDTAIARAPRETAFRIAQLRTLRTLGYSDRMRAAFEKWRHDVPNDPSPYREFARTLIDAGFTASADTVLREGQDATGSGRDFAYELAQLRAAKGLWAPSAQSWREAVAHNAYLDQAAIFALAPTPDSVRDAVERALLAPPPTPQALHVAAALHLAWGAPRAAWEVLKTLRADSAAVAVWLDFASRAEESEAWLVARDALVAADAARPDARVAARAATDALSGDDPASAAALAANAERTLDSATVARVLLPVHVRALGALGKPADAQRVMEAYLPYLDPGQKADAGRLLAMAWVRAGDLDRARQMLTESGGDDPATEGWIALYSGNLAGARKALRPAADASVERLSAVALLERTRADQSPDMGAAFLALARGDTLGAAAKFEQAARTLPDAASLLLASAARLYDARNADAQAAAIWKIIVTTMATTPEAPEAELSWARSLRRGGHAADAVTHLEHMILTYPESALVPQARRELELARSAVPSTF